MIEEKESWPGELKALREFFDITISEVSFTMPMIDRTCGPLYKDYLKRKSIKENYEKLNNINPLPHDYELDN